MPLLLWPLSLMAAMVCVVPPGSTTSSSSISVSVAVVLGISVLLLLLRTTVAAMDTGPSSTWELNWGRFHGPPSIVATIMTRSITRISLLLVVGRMWRVPGSAGGCRGSWCLWCLEVSDDGGSISLVLSVVERVQRYTFVGPAEHCWKTRVKRKSGGRKREEKKKCRKGGRKRREREREEWRGSV